MNKNLFLALAMIGVFLWCGSSAFATNVLPGVDLWSTPCGGATVDSHFTVMPLPPGFFDPGSDPFSGSIEFKGQPLTTTPPGILGPSDVIVERKTVAVLPAVGDSDRVPIEIIALSLTSCNPITVTYNGGSSPELWDVKACLSSTQPQNVGSMIIRRGCNAGGTFSATLPVTPKFIFIRQSDLAQRVLDLGGMLTIDFETERLCKGQWTYSDPGFGIFTSPGGLTVDHDCNPSTPEVPVGASSNFFPGVQAIPCNPIQPPQQYKKLMTHEEAQLAAHGVLPPEQHEQDRDSDCIPDTADNCPNIPNPLQTDSDCDGVGDACELESFYWKPPYPDYAPSGMPDFDQKQDNWKKMETGNWTFCGPVAVANCFWWFDSKFNVPPGDGLDRFSLVRDYMDGLAPLIPPFWDDHDPWNVDHAGTPWAPPGIPAPPPTAQPFVPGPQPQPSGMPAWGELVERLAWYLNTDGIRTGYCAFSGTIILDMKAGIDLWLASETLSVGGTLADFFYDTLIWKPSFAAVESLVEISEDVILLLGFWWFDGANWHRNGGHYVTMAGVYSDSLKVAFSDPYFDNAEPPPQGNGGPGVVGNGTFIAHPNPHGGPTHNDAGNISHDIYGPANLESPSPGGIWALHDYPPTYDSASLVQFMQKFYNQNVPYEFVSMTAPYQWPFPQVTEVEYAMVISPKPICNPPQINCPGDESQNINGVYTTTTNWSADDGNPGDPSIMITAVNICGVLPPGITGASVNVDPPGLPAKTATGTVTYTVGDHCQPGGPICLQVTNNCTPPLSASCTFNVILINNPPVITQPDTLSSYAGYQVSYTISGTDPDADSIHDQASIQITPACGAYSITRISGQGTPTGTWQVSWQTNGCLPDTYLVIHDLTDGCDTSYCSTYVHLYQPVGWYWKPPYPDYAPNGMPDIDQKQDNWVKLPGQWTFCGPVAVANCFKWFDSKYNIPPGFPGDMMDMFPLVRQYIDQMGGMVGPYDDHDPLNMDHPVTPWLQAATPPPPPTLPQPFVPGPQPPGPMPPWGELVERLAWYLNTDGVSTGYCAFSGTNVIQMEQGIQQWFLSETFPNGSTLADTLCEVTLKAPTFAKVESLVEKSEDVILLLGFWWFDGVNWRRSGGHYVTVAGVNSPQSQIAFSDPFFDNAELGNPGIVLNGMLIPHVPIPGHGATVHNDEGNVSHDIYATAGSPSPGGVWGLPGYPVSLTPSYSYIFSQQNVPGEFIPDTGTWNGIAPVFTEVEYAVHISPWDYRGDVNNNGSVALGDVVYLITYLYKGGPPPPVMTEADMNCDGVVNLGDVVFLITYLYKNGPVPKCCDP